MVSVKFDDQQVESGLCEPAGLAPHMMKVVDGNLDDDGRPKRTGTVWTAYAHIVTACIGAGVLSLAWAMSQLGWVAGICILLIFSSISLLTANLLADCYRSPDPVSGKRNYSYMEAVKTILGGTMHLFCGWILYGSLATCAVGYTITGAKSLVAIQKSNCNRKNGGNAACKFSIYPHMLGFGVVEILLSQIPNFHKLTWLSTIAAIMSFGYTSIGIALSIFKIVHEGGGTTSVTGAEVGASDKVWRMFAATGDIAFACTYAQVLMDIQDTIKSSAAEEGNRSVMKKASTIGVSTMTLLFMMCGCLGYAAFGEHAPENLLTGFAFDHKAYWVMNLANLFIVVHLVGAYQVFAQPVFRVVELWAAEKWAKSGFVNTDHQVSFVGNKVRFHVNLFKVGWRTSFVAVASVIAMALPFFTDILALLGAVEYWPVVVYFPVEMHIKQNNIPKGTKKWIALQLLSLMCLLVSFASAAGAIQGLLKGLRTFQPFKTKD